MRARWMLMVPVLAVLLPGPTPAAAQQADWKAKERQCMQDCPRFPRFSGIETNAQYQARMRAQAAYDRCMMECARQSAESFPKSFTPISKSARDYYERNAKRWE